MKASIFLHRYLIPLALEVPAENHLKDHKAKGLETVKPLYTDIRYNDKIRSNDSLNGTNP